jgi:hypothetical protein
MLIKELQDVQHQHGYLPREALQALAERLKVPFFEVYGVASFYPHFRFEPSTGTTMKICTELSSRWCQRHDGSRSGGLSAGGAARVGVHCGNLLPGTLRCTGGLRPE